MADTYEFVDIEVLKKFFDAHTKMDSSNDGEQEECFNKLKVEYEKGKRHSYTDIFILLQKYEKVQRDQIALSVHDYYCNKEIDKYKSNLLKLYDHINLEVQRMALIEKPIKNKVDEALDKANKAMSEAEQAEKKIKQAEKKIEDSQKHLIASLGIFATIITAFGFTANITIGFLQAKGNTFGQNLVYTLIIFLSIIYVFSKLYDLLCKFNGISVNTENNKKVMKILKILLECIPCIFIIALIVLSIIAIYEYFSNTSILNKVNL